MVMAFSYLFGALVFLFFSCAEIQEWAHKELFSCKDESENTERKELK